MTKLCPACLGEVQKGTLDCPHCAHDMRAGPRDETKGPKLLDTPSGAALIASYRTGSERQGGWRNVARAFVGEAGAFVDAGGSHWPLPDAFVPHVKSVRWIRIEDGQVSALLVPNGRSQTTAVQISADGRSLVVPLPGVEAAA